MVVVVGWWQWLRTAAWRRRQATHRPQRRSEPAAIGWFHLSRGAGETPGGGVRRKIGRGNLHGDWGGGGGAIGEGMGEGGGGGISVK